MSSYYVSDDVAEFVQSPNKDAMRDSLDMDARIEQAITDRLAPLVPSFTSQPQKRYVAVGGTKAFSGVASSLIDLPVEYEAEESQDGDTWNAAGEAANGEYSPPPANLDDDGKLIRLKATTAFGSAVSEAAALVVEKGPSITNAYDAEVKSKWAIGTLLGSLNYSGASGVGTVRWGIWGLPFNVTPGQYLIDKFSARMAFTYEAAVTTALFCIWKKVGNDLEEVMQFDITSQLNRIDGTANTVANINQEVTIGSGEFVYGIAMLTGSGRRSGEPGLRSGNEGLADPGYYWFGVVDNTTLPTTITAPTVGFANTVFRMQVEFSTANRIVSQLPAIASATKRLIPRRLDGVQTTKINSFACATGNSLAVRYYSGGSGDVLHCAADFSNDSLTVGVQSQSVAGQSGNTFDMLLQSSTSGYDVLYVNRTKGQGGQGDNDLCTISHRAKYTANRTSLYTNTDATSVAWIAIEGTGSIGSIQVGWEPVVIFGDSMSSFSGRYGQYLPDAFTFPRISWRAGISGNTLVATAVGNHTAGYLRYKHTTPGAGDVCQIRNCILAFCGMALNDVQGIGTNPSNVATVTSNYLGRLTEIVDDAIVRDNVPLIIGTAPYNHPTHTSVLEAQALITWSELISELCEDRKIAWYSPWWDCVDLSTRLDDIPKLKTEFDADGGTHLNATAIQHLCPLIVQAFESGIVGGTFDPELNRYRLKLDVLVEA